jgi:UDP-N-acetylmuramoyl-L-alanyl-D-glutamate--2,6-diaminopimelate ligase
MGFIQFLRKITPLWAFSAYHRSLSWLAAVWYGNPSRQMTVIGVTGTNGKTSTCYFLAHALEASGAKTGMTSTALFKVADREWTNDRKMTMLGRFQLQRLLREMVDAGCAYAVIETSSQGVVQHRHRGIAYDVCVFTNLTPEHIEAHGGFENYKQAKIDFFRHTVALPRKTISGKKAPRMAIINGDDGHGKDFAIKGFDRVVTFGVGDHTDVKATGVNETLDGVTFTVGSTSFSLKTPGHVTVLNTLAAIATAEALDINGDLIASRLKILPGMPGRYERIDGGQSFTVIVDYAFEPVALTALLDFVVSKKGNGRIIHVTGSAGGGRDVARRPVMGQISGERCDVTIVTNEDPYDDDPRTIIDQVAAGAMKAGKIEGKTLFKILDRGEAIQRAVSLAKAGDVVLITGKGSEPVIAGPNRTKIPFDDRDVARRHLRSL